MKRAKWMLAATMLMSSSLMFAQTLHRTVVAQVPFEFMVGSKIIPAGECVVVTEATNVVSIHNYSAKQGALSTALRADENKDGRTVMAFERRGDQYFLAEIRIEGSDLTYKLPESRAEAELRAQNAPASTVTLLAALK
ncbi:MAG TPA: hypothetical protein VNW47_05740 [Terriglobales bacterium]|nr:hypothetical protein [Terriglobales bacterium]